MGEARKYNTRQRAEILNCVQESGDSHFTAAEIAGRLHRRGSAVGLSTIYRLLDSMVEKGEMRRYIIDGATAACYQLPGPDADQNRCRHHFHLKCLVCGKLLHVECAHIDELTTHISESHGFTIDNTKTVLYGVCSDCAASKTDKAPAAAILPDEK